MKNYLKKNVWDNSLGTVIKKLNLWKIIKKCDQKVKGEIIKAMSLMKIGEKLILKEKTYMVE